MDDELRLLKNLGKTSVQWLNAVGIHSRHELHQRGAVNAYQAVLKRGFRASKSLLYAIDAALQDIHLSQLPESRKAELNGLLSQILDNNKS